MLLFPTDEFAGAVEELPAEEIAGFLGDFFLGDFFFGDFAAFLRGFRKVTHS